MDGTSSNFKARCWYVQEKSLTLSVFSLELRLYAWESTELESRDSEQVTVTVTVVLATIQ